MDRIAYVVHMERGWSKSSVLAVLADPRIKNRPYGVVALAFHGLVLDPNTRKPTRILEHGPWWEMANSFFGIKADDMSPVPPPSDTPRDQRCFYCSRTQADCVGRYDRTHEFVAYATELERINGPEAQERIAQAKARARASVSKPTTVPAKGSA